MTEPATEGPDPPDRARAEAVAALHLAALRRQFAAIRGIFGEDPPHRSREALWAGLEVVLAELRGERISQRDLVARAQGLLSAPTLSRVVAGLEHDGLLTSEPGPGRLKLLRPTPRALEALSARSDEAFSEFAAILREAERRSGDGGAGAPAATPPPDGKAAPDSARRQRSDAIGAKRFR